MTLARRVGAEELLGGKETEVRESEQAPFQTKKRAPDEGSSWLRIRRAVL